jgi:acetyl-CoA acetyltransferase
MGGGLTGISVSKPGAAAVVMMFPGKAGEPGLEPLARDGLATLCIGGGQGVAMALALVS